MGLPSTPRSKLLLGLVLTLAVYWLAMFVGTHWPLATAPRNNSYSLDKWLHATAFAGLAVLCCGVGAVWRGTSWKLYAGVFALLAAYGLLDELTQSLVFNRDASMMDWLADLVGTAGGIAAFALTRLARSCAQSCFGRNTTR